jgi:2-polyprenyl-3-methyl-5-hydroxy-6-metoxy-1,4-benzoquinol methylase
MKSKKLLWLCTLAIVLSVTTIALKKNPKHSPRSHRRVVQTVTLQEELVSNDDVFADIYKRGEWGTDESGKGNSGTGSDPENAKKYIDFLQNYLTQNNIKSVVDLGCGDWRISRTINWDGVRYLGIDVVASVIQENIEHFAAPNISFLKADGSDTCLPAADLLICKDILQHLPFQDIHEIISQFGKFRHCIIVNDVNPSTLTCENMDIPRGHYRSLDLTQPPFSMLGEKVLNYSSGPNGELKQVLIIKSNG